MEVFKVFDNNASHRRVSLSKRSLASLILAARYGDPPAHTNKFYLIVISPLSFLLTGLYPSLYVFVFFIVSLTRR